MYMNPHICINVYIILTHIMYRYLFVSIVYSENSLFAPKNDLLVYLHIFHYN